MSIARAFTTRRNAKRSEISAPMPQRSLTTKHSFAAGTIRNKISGPVELVSTTNMLSYNAPDIFPSSSRSSNSGDDSDRTPSSPSSASTAPTTPDSSSVESSPSSLEPNHLSCYFGAPSSQSGSGDEAPVIPKRALSHTKKSHEILSRQRSISRISSPKSSISMSRMSSPQNSISTTRSSINTVTANVEHPFGNELAQVSELAEEYGISKETMIVVDEEEQELISRGLFKFRAEDYMSEIQGLFLSAFGESKPKMSTMWI